MDYFQVAEKINQLHQLDFAERALLNQITSYFFNSKPFFATNEYLSNYWGVSERSISRYISKLSKLGYIDVEIEKKKHTIGEAKWYNKRYILPNIDNILPQAPKEEKTPINNPVILTLENDDEPVLGVFPEQDNEFTRAFKMLTGETKCDNTTEFTADTKKLSKIKENEAVLTPIEQMIKEIKEIDLNSELGILKRSTISHVLSKSDSLGDEGVTHFYNNIFSKVEV